MCVWTIFGVGAMFPPSLFCVELRRLIVDVSTLEDPIDVKLAMLLHLPGRGSDRCEFYYYAAIQLYANYARGFALLFSAFHYNYYYCHDIIQCARFTFKIIISPFNAHVSNLN